MLPERPVTPRCYEWAAKVGEQFDLLQDFAEWFENRVLDGYAGDDYPLPDRNWIERYLTEEREFDFAELERERRAIIDYQVALNEEAEE